MTREQINAQLNQLDATLRTAHDWIVELRSSAQDIPGDPSVCPLCGSKLVARSNELRCNKCARCGASYRYRLVERQQLELLPEEKGDTQ